MRLVETWVHQKVLDLLGLILCIKTVSPIVVLLLDLILNLAEILLHLRSIVAELILALDEVLLHRRKVLAELVLALTKVLLHRRDAEVLLYRWDVLAELLLSLTKVLLHWRDAMVELALPLTKVLLHPRDVLVDLILTKALLRPRHILGCLGLLNRGASGGFKGPRLTSIQPKAEDERHGVVRMQVQLHFTLSVSKDLPKILKQLDDLRIIYFELGEIERPREALVEPEHLLEGEDLWMHIFPVTDQGVFVEGIAHFREQTDSGTRIVAIVQARNASSIGAISKLLKLVGNELLADCSHGVDQALAGLAVANLLLIT